MFYLQNFDRWRVLAMFLFWVVTPCRYRRFGKNTVSISNSWVDIIFILSPEDGDSMFFRNFSIYLQDQTAEIVLPTRPTSTNALNASLYTLHKRFDAAFRLLQVWPLLVYYINQSRLQMLLPRCVQAVLALANSYVPGEFIKWVDIYHKNNVADSPRNTENANKIENQQKWS